MKKFEILVRAMSYPKAIIIEAEDMADAMEKGNNLTPDQLEPLITQAIEGGQWDYSCVDIKMVERPNEIFFIKYCGEEYKIKVHNKLMFGSTTLHSALFSGGRPANDIASLIDANIDFYFTDEEFKNKTAEELYNGLYSKDDIGPLLMA